MIHCHLGFIPGSSFFMLSLAEVLSEILEMLLMCHPERSVTKSKDLRHYTFTKKDEVFASPFVILEPRRGDRIHDLPYSFQPVYFAVSRISLAFWTRSAVGDCVSLSA